MTEEDLRRIEDAIEVGPVALKFDANGSRVSEAIWVKLPEVYELLAKARTMMKENETLRAWVEANAWDSEYTACLSPGCNAQSSYLEGGGRVTRPPHSPDCEVVALLGREPKP